MADLKTVLISYMRGQSELDEVSESLKDLMRKAPDKAPLVQELFARAREKGLPAAAYQRLVNELQQSIAPPQGEGFPETVVLQVSPLAGAPPHSSAEPSAPPETEADSDKTKLVSGQEIGANADAAAAVGEAMAAVDAMPEGTVDATALGIADKQPDPDATVLAPDDAPPTALGLGSASGANAGDDPTELAGADQDEATRIAGSAPEADETARPDDATQVAASDATTFDPASAEDATLIAPEHEDATEMNPASNVGGAGGAVAASPDDATEIGEAGSEFDILSQTALNAAEGSRERASNTGASWPTEVDPPQSGAGITRDFQEGDLLRGRFQLISKLGEGGMGAVWKGLDKLKEEARDRNPYVAIKLLQGDFKEHPEAFIALQRETSKQQRLAHPNIATVYDFDRDDATNTVFMTMEVLEGQPLDAFVRKLPADGLTEEEAVPLIEQLCNGLAYAHSHGLVHSDLKPGNCFLTNEGNIKLLDFGIARASKTKTDAEGETTLFDPGELGALTPTYATIEMFNGEDPDPRDDIYALGVMSYQLLTGKHPYGRKSAPKAKELGLVPETIDKVSKSQNRALQRSVAFARADRTDTVENFFADIQRKKSRAPMFAAAGIVLSLITAGALYPTVADWFNERERNQVLAVLTQPGIDNIKAGLQQAEALGGEQKELILEAAATRSAIALHIAKGDEKSIEEGISAIAPFDEPFQRAVLNEDDARKAIFDFYQTQILDAFDPAEERYAYAAANEIVTRLDSLYPDSAQVLEIRNGLDSEKKATLGALSQKYKRFLDEGFLIPNPNEEDISDVLQVVKQIDPRHRLLNDKLLTFAFTKQAEKAFEAQEYQLANDYLEASTAYVTDDKRLNDLAFQVHSELQRIEDAARVAEIEQRLAGQLDDLKSLEDFQGVRDDLAVLAELSPGNETLAKIRANLEAAFNAALKKDIAAKRWPEAEALIFDFAKLFDIPFLAEQRAALSAAEDRAGYQRPESEERDRTIQERTAQIEELLAAPSFTSDWELRLRVPHKELLALLQPGDPRLEQVRSQTADLYLQRAQGARQSGSFSEALAYLNKGRGFYPAWPDFDAESKAIEAAKERERLARLEEERKTRIASLKEEFIEKAANDEVNEARAVLDSLDKERLEEGDDFLTAQAPSLLSAAYVRRAASLAEANEYSGALTLAEAALRLTPQEPGLEDVVVNYRAEVQRRQLQINLAALFDSLDPLDPAKVKRDLVQLEESFPNEYSALFRRFGAARAQAIIALAERPDGNLQTVASRLNELRQVMPDAHQGALDRVVEVVEARLEQAPVNTPAALRSLKVPLAQFHRISRQRHAALSQSLGEQIAARVRQLEPTDKGAAFALWSVGRDAVPDSQQLASINIEPPVPELAEARQRMDEGKLTAATSLLAAAKSRYAQHSELPPLERRLASAKANAEQEYAEYQKAASASIRSSEQRRFDGRLESILRRWSDREPGFERVVIRGLAKGECHPSLAGYGKRRVCYDKVARRKGPDLIVVPQGGEIAQPFAISKYEVTVADYNHYCNRTKRCKATRKNTRVPVTGLTVAEAEAYAKWLSEEASKAGSNVTYRLPTNAEWEHAAQAAGKQPPKEYNCTVMGTSGQKVAGHALIDAKAGAANGWGLTNYVGNAQEWVRIGNGVIVRGGAFEDPLDKCDLSISRQHSGGADPITGFRLVRELG